MTHASPSMRDTAVVHRPGRLSRRESRLAFGMTLPSILIVMAIVLFPLLTTFWISAKPIELADLRAPEVRAREQVKGEAVAADDVFLLRYKLRNSSRDKPVLDVRLEDSLPAGLVPLELDPRCELAADRSLRCALGEFEPGQSETLNIDVRAEQAFIDNPQSAKDSEVVMTGRSLNPLLTLDFTRENFIKAFGVREFGTVLWVTFVYTIGGTAGALVLGLFAALLLNQTFRGRAVFRGFLLFLRRAGDRGGLHLGGHARPFLGLAEHAAGADGGGGRADKLLWRAHGSNPNIRSVDPVPAGAEHGDRLRGLALFPALVPVHPRADAVDPAGYVRGRRYGWRLAVPEVLGAEPATAGGDHGGAVPAALHLDLQQVRRHLPAHRGNAGTRTLTVQVYEQAFALNNLGAGAAVAVLVFVLLALFALVYFRAMPEEEGL